MALIACGGGSDEPVATPAPTSTALPAGPTATAGPTPERAFQTYHYFTDLAVVLDSETGGAVTSYVRHVEGYFAAPDAHSFIGTVETGGSTIQQQIVTIGADAWFREGDAWSTTTRNELASAGVTVLTSATPGFLNAAGFGDALAGLERSEVQTAGVLAWRYQVSRSDADADAVAALLRNALIQDGAPLETFALTVWVDQATGGLVRAELSASGGADAILGSEVPAEVPADTSATITMTVFLSQIDDTGIVISPPL